MKKILMLCYLATYLFLCDFAFANSIQIIYQRGNVSYLRDNVVKKLKNQILKKNDVIKTDKDALVILKTKKITLKISENTIISLNKIDDEVFETEILYGAIVVNYIKNGLKPNKVPLKIKTPYSLVGVRGTTFFTSVSPNLKNTVVSVKDGRVTHEQNDTGEVLIEKQQSSFATMTKVIDAQNFEFEKDINWNITKIDQNLEHPQSLFLKIEKTWEDYKKKLDQTWSDRKKSMDERWNQRK